MKRIVAIFFALIMTLAGCAGGGETNGATWQEQYDLGIRYLSEGNYQEAIIAFTAAIEIDEKQPSAYVGRGDAYSALAEQEEDSAVAVSLWESAAADYEQALSLGDAQAEEKLQGSKVTLQRLQASQAAQPLLVELFALFQQGDLENAKNLMRQDSYSSLSSSLEDNLYYFDEDSATALAVYPDNFYYYGEWENGLRSGRGLWIRAKFDAEDDDESYIYEGEWADDLPNGEGTIIRNRYPEKIHLEPGRTTSIHTEVKGTFSNGLYHGTIYETWTMNDGGTHRWTPITAVNGIYQIVEYDGDRAVVARDQENESTTLSVDSTHVVRGLGLNSSS